MSESETIRFARLNDSNYAEWAIRMEAVLIKKGLWSLVHFEIDPTGKDAETVVAEYEKLKKARSITKSKEARAELILRVDDGQLAHMHSADPMEIWDTLERVHRAAGFATSLALRRRFLTGKKTDDQSMQSWIGQVQSLAFRMAHAGIAITDQDRILTLTMGLPGTYDAVIINFDSTPADQLTLNNVITRLLNEELRQTSQIPPAEKQHVDEALAVTRSGTRRARSTGTPVATDVTCFFCDGKGHYKSECPEKKDWEKMKAKTGLVGLAEEDSEDEGAF